MLRNLGIYLFFWPPPASTLMLQMLCAARGGHGDEHETKQPESGRVKYRATVRDRCFMVAPLVLVGTKTRLTIINGHRHDIEISV